MRVGKETDGIPDSENINFSSQEAYGFSGFKHLLTLEAIQEPFQLALSGRKNFLFIANSNFL